MNKYVVIGTYLNGNKKAFVLMESTQRKAIQSLLADVKDSFSNIEVIDLNDGFPAIGMASFYSNGNNFYQNVAEAMELIHRSMDKYEIAGALDENGEPTDKFHDRWNSYFTTLIEDGQKALLSLLGTAKGLVNIAELAGHDCL